MTSIKDNPPNVLYVLVGLPAAGKTASAIESERPIVSLKAVREAIHGPVYNNSSELLVLATAKTMVKALFLAGHKEVVYDGLSITAADRKQLADNLWIRSFIIVDVDKQSCIQKAIESAKSHLIDSIVKCADRFQPVTHEEFTMRELHYKNKVLGSDHDY